MFLGHGCSDELWGALIDAAMTADNDAFVILSASEVIGTFDSQGVPAHYEVVYDATDMPRQLLLPSLDHIDGYINLKDFALFQSRYAR